jgi:hypothetical protein
MGTGHYYFDEMRSSFNLVQNQLFALTKLYIYKTNCPKISATAPAAVHPQAMFNKGSLFYSHCGQSSKNALFTQLACDDYIRFIKTFSKQIAPDHTFFESTVKAWVQWVQIGWSLLSAT